MVNEIFILVICFLLILFFENLIQKHINSNNTFNEINNNLNRNFLLVHLKNVLKLCKIVIIVITLKMIFISIESLINTF